MRQYSRVPTRDPAHFMTEEKGVEAEGSRMVGDNHRRSPRGKVLVAAQAETKIATERFKSARLQKLKRKTSGGAIGRIGHIRRIVRRLSVVKEGCTERSGDRCSTRVLD